MPEQKYYKIKIDEKEKAPEIKTTEIAPEKLSEEQKKDYIETKEENNGKTAWLMPSGSIFWSFAGTEINNAKKIIQKTENQKRKKQKKEKTKKKKNKK